MVLGANIAMGDSSAEINLVNVRRATKTGEVLNCGSSWIYVLSIGRRCRDSGQIKRTYSSVPSIRLMLAKKYPSW